MARILVTGAAGFIGMHVCRALLARGEQVLGIDRLDAYYDPALKQARLAQLEPHAGFSFERVDMADAAALTGVFARGAVDRVVHLAAQAGVRHSLTNPQAYVESNLVGFANLLEACRGRVIAHLVYASSSSVYGASDRLPFAEDDPADQPLSLYAASKRANELMAHSHAHLHGLPCSGLRLFTVHGPWGRPDMACWLFTRALLAGEPIELFNHGRMQRDFTDIDDVVPALLAVLDRPPSGPAPHRVLNVGGGTPVTLRAFVAALEGALGVRARLQLRPMQPGDVPATWADTRRLRALIGHVPPPVPLDEGLRRFVRWYRARQGAPALVERAT